MEFMSAPWWSALLTIILIDLVLAGDNAIVIALAARNLPPALKQKAIIWGTVGAIVVRSVMTVGVVWLLKIPGLMLVGGLGLLWIAYQLLADQGDGDHGAMDLVIIGLLISVPIVVFGSNVVLKLVERFPSIIMIGAAVLAFTAAKMVVHEPWLVSFFGTDADLTSTQSMTRWAVYVLAIVAVLGAGWLTQKRNSAVDTAA